MSMDGFGDLIGLWLRGLIGFGALFGLLYLSVSLQARMWRAFGAHYGQAKHMSVLARKIPETIVISRSGNDSPRLGWRQDFAVYPWSIISVLEDGLLISAIPPVSLICKDIYLPFDAMSIRRHPWMQWQDPYAISMDKASDLIIIIGQDTLQWLRQNTGQARFNQA